MHGQHIIISQTNIYIFSTFVRRLTLLFLTQMMYIPGLDIGFSSDPRMPKHALHQY